LNQDLIKNKQKKNRDLISLEINVLDDIIINNNDYNNASMPELKNKIKKTQNTITRLESEKQKINRRK